MAGAAAIALYSRHSIDAAFSLGVDMARMFPERPRAGAPTSERRVYDYLERTLDERFVVFHSLAWHGRANKADGEVDFLIAHPDLGMLVLEVKGGGIAYDPVRGKWTSQNKEGHVNEVNDPGTRRSMPAAPCVISCGRTLAGRIGSRRWAGRSS